MTTRPTLAALIALTAASPLYADFPREEVQPGDVVKKGDRLAVLEAMKMEHALLAGMDSVVSEVPCSEGAQVNAGDVLILMEEGAV